MLQCEHSPKYIRLTIDAGIREIVYLELCKVCHSEQKLTFVIDKEMMN